jgi:hypothetical protein
MRPAWSALALALGAVYLAPRGGAVLPAGPAAGERVATTVKWPALPPLSGQELYGLSRRRAARPAHHAVQVGHALSEVRAGQKISGLSDAAHVPPCRVSGAAGQTFYVPGLAGDPAAALETLGVFKKIDKHYMRIGGAAAAAAADAGRIPADQLEGFPAGTWAWLAPGAVPGECVLGDAADGSTLDASVKWSLGLTRTGAMFALHGMQRQLAPESGGSSQRLLLAEEGAAAAAAFAAAMCGLDGAGAPCTDYPDACGDEGRCSRETMALLASRYDGVPGAAGAAPSGGAKRPRRSSDIGGQVALAGT